MDIDGTFVAVFVTNEKFNGKPGKVICIGSNRLMYIVAKNLFNYS